MGNSISEKSNQGGCEINYNTGNFDEYETCKTLSLYDNESKGNILKILDEIEPLLRRCFSFKKLSSTYASDFERGIAIIAGVEFEFIKKEGAIACDKAGYLSIIQEATGAPLSETYYTDNHFIVDVTRDYFEKLES